MTCLEALVAELRRQDPHVRITAQRHLVTEHFAIFGTCQACWSHKHGGQSE